MLSRRQFLGYSALAPALLRSSVLGGADKGPKISARAMEVHKRALVFDGMFTRSIASSITVAVWATRIRGIWDLPRAREGGVSAFFLSMYIPEEYYPGRFETKQAFRRVDHALRQLEENRDQVESRSTPTTWSGSMPKARSPRCSISRAARIWMAIWGCFRDLYRLGLRSAQLSAHNWNQHYADSCCSRRNGMASPRTAAR